MRPRALRPQVHLGVFHLCAAGHLRRISSGFCNRVQHAASSCLGGVQPAFAGVRRDAPRHALRPSLGSVLDSACGAYGLLLGPGHLVLSRFLGRASESGGIDLT